MKVIYIIGLIIVAEAAFLSFSYVQEKALYSYYYETYEGDYLYEEEISEVEHLEEEVVEVEEPACAGEFIFVLNDLVEDAQGFKKSQSFTVKQGHLDLSRTRLQDIPTDVTEENCITSIDLEHNVIDYFPSELSKLPNLQFLTLAHNNISDIQALGALYALKHLDLSSNDLSEIPPLRYLKNLEYLSLRGNYGLSYSSNLQQLGNLPLKILDIQYTNLAKDKRAIAELQELLPNAMISY